MMRPLSRILTPAKLRKLDAALKQSAADVKAAEERAKKAPRLNFIASAKRAGFTTKQAQFLWEESRMSVLI